MEEDIEWIVKEEVLKEFKVRFVPSFVVITLWPSLPQIQHALLLQYYRFRSPPLYPLSQFYIGSQVWNPLLSPLPLSPRLSTAYSTRYLPAPNLLYLPLLLLDAISILEREEAVERCQTEMIPWTAEFATSLAGGGMLRVMIPGRVRML